ncbi:hypothetical protein DPMN_049720 [Dreissena polymorpha]|uniref:Uncharacterized protein n=1 Tax=Dreissena polymorpha TaxID=45954 RepID=A0A9D4CG76_DREPO|nr:hypothetical protein DPMN_049720 [Dreissena polymorpha]
MGLMTKIGQYRARLVRSYMYPIRLCDDESSRDIKAPDLSSLMRRLVFRYASSA